MRLADRHDVGNDGGAEATVNQRFNQDCSEGGEQEESDWVGLAPRAQLKDASQTLGCVFPEAETFVPGRPQTGDGHFDLLRVGGSVHAHS